ncbi:hypothetical protein LSCM1_02024 [Leishmania martiniquensis]|uniref:Guanine nucleotide-binding protein subunit beta-like protein n=1 Tax=Leishmania martiniquensis TaxID=1580590 RepID=A0A836GS12_9TRYP|nr:hypothetical protein LSCM1_02024 [Leishmania martiniquensis]
MPLFYKEETHVRRLYSAPDNSSKLLATCDRGYVPSLAYTASTDSPSVVAEDAKTGPRVRLPFPAIDIAWCPFKNGPTNAAFTTTCRSRPIQLWDLEDAELRASYVAANDSDYHVHAHALCWFKAPTHQHWIAGGYGGFEDATQVRVFDIMAEGSQPIWTYGSKHWKGVVSSMHDCQWQGTTPLLAVGCYNAPSVYLIDCRSQCPVATLHGLRQGVQVIRSGVEGVDPYCVYAGGSQGDSRIMCWDVRQPCAPLFSVSRLVCTNQVFQFELLTLSSTASSHDDAADCSRGLVTTCSTGGVLLYRWRPGSTPADNTGVSIDSFVGPTSGLALVGPSTVVVSTGSRPYGGSFDASKKKSGPLPSCSLLCDSHCDDAEGFFGFPVYKRQRSPMHGDSDEDSGFSEHQAKRTTDATNITVVQLVCGQV